MKLSRYVMLLIIPLLFLTACEEEKQEEKKAFDHSDWSLVLEKNVDSLGMVDYVGVSKDTNYVNYLRKIVVADTSGMTDKEKMAFFLNAYNAFTIKHVIEEWPIMSPKDVENFFKKDKFTIADDQFSLDNIQYDVLMPINDTLVHFGLVCASQGCAPLMQEAFVADSVYKQLKRNAKRYLAMEDKNRLDKDANVLYISEMFKWYEDEFTEEYGSMKDAVVQFMSYEDKKYVTEHDVDLEYMDYNWNLNMQGPDEKEEDKEK